MVDDGEATYSRCTGVAADNLTPDMLDGSSRDFPVIQARLGKRDGALEGCSPVLLSRSAASSALTGAQIARDGRRDPRTPKIVIAGTRVRTAAAITPTATSTTRSPSTGSPDSVATSVTVV